MLWSNERVTLVGNWQHGFFAMTFLAATALAGRMKLDAEPDLKIDQVRGLERTGCKGRANRAVAVLSCSHLPCSLRFAAHRHAQVNRLSDGVAAHPREGPLLHARIQRASRRCCTHRRGGGIDAAGGAGCARVSSTAPLCRAGDHIGHFSVGSGIAMIYEAPRDWKLRPEATTVGHSFKLGEAMAMH
jgi:hypothetical protein